MATTLFALAMLFGIVLFWLDGARAREFATALVGELCQRRGLQLLDGTVALARVALRRTPQGLRFRRMYRFDFTAEGLGRRVGYVLLLGTAVERIIFDLPERPETERDEESKTAEAPPSNVVPLRRPGRRT